MHGLEDTKVDTKDRANHQTSPVLLDVLEIIGKYWKVPESTGYKCLLIWVEVRYKLWSKCCLNALDKHAWPFMASVGSRQEVLVQIGLCVSQQGRSHAKVPGGGVGDVLAGGHLAAVVVVLNPIILKMYGRK